MNANVDDSVGEEASAPKPALDLAACTRSELIKHVNTLRRATKATPGISPVQDEIANLEKKIHALVEETRANTVVLNELSRSISSSTADSESFLASLRALTKEISQLVAAVNSTHPRGNRSFAADDVIPVLTPDADLVDDQKTARVEHNLIQTAKPPTEAQQKRKRNAPVVTPESVPAHNESLDSEPKSKKR